MTPPMPRAAMSRATAAAELTGSCDTPGRVAMCRGESSPAWKKSGYTRSSTVTRVSRTIRRSPSLPRSRRGRDCGNPLAKLTTDIVLPSPQASTPAGRRPARQPPAPWLPARQPPPAVLPPLLRAAPPSCTDRPATATGAFPWRRTSTFAERRSRPALAGSPRGLAARAASAAAARPRRDTPGLPPLGRHEPRPPDPAPRATAGFGPSTRSSAPTVPSRATMRRYTEIAAACCPCASNT